MSKIIILIAVLLIIFFAYQRMATTKKLSAENLAKGADFLIANKEKEGVKETSTGLQYLVLNEGSGDKHPAATDTVSVHYHGTLLDGSVFDSSVERGEPLAFGLHQVIPGWTEGLQLMVVGEKTRLFIPSNLAYGNRGAGSIAPGSVLIFDVELLAINP